MAGTGNFWVKRRKGWVDDDPGGKEMVAEKIGFFRRTLKKRKKQRKEGVARNERDFLGLGEKQS